MLLMELLSASGQSIKLPKISVIRYTKSSLKYSKEKTKVVIYFLMSNVLSIYNKQIFAYYVSNNSLFMSLEAQFFMLNIQAMITSGLFTSSFLSPTTSTSRSIFQSITIPITYDTNSSYNKVIFHLAFSIVSSSLIQRPTKEFKTA